MQVIILGSGSKGNSTLLITDSKKILIDVGFSYSKTKMILEKYDIDINDIDFILLTHNHSDHIAGLASLTKKTKKFVYIPSKMVKVVNKIVDMDYIMPVTKDDIDIDDLHIKFIHTSHDAESPVGFVFEDTMSLVYITDTGYLSQKNLSYMHNKTMYIMESNHDPEMLMNGTYPYLTKIRIIGDQGHLSNEMAGKYLSELIGDNTKEIILIHLSEHNNLEELALSTVRTLIDNRVPVIAARQEEDMKISI